NEEIQTSSIEYDFTRLLNLQNKLYEVGLRVNATINDDTKG
ncbi:10257_t:CDS:1, partial [Racocetra persica]